MSDNPYASPQSSFEPIGNSVGGLAIDNMPVASQNKRLINFFVDNIMTQILSMAGGFVLGMAAAANAGGQLTPEEAGRLQLLGMLVGLIIMLIYFVGMEVATGATIGKLLTGTRVVNAGGGKASFGQIFGRTLARMIPFEPFSFLFGDKTTGWHDSLSGTRVIDTRG
ncbi:RDD family protein [Planctomycetes bacterium K23_9]|uniref:RDD family protein n=1 Tax=Stieleria marina TaxID=1930275 RepID=A0A517NV17_9BACT|nr:RDD family protein [Planctomycetes bacterium K23_9]